VRNLSGSLSTLWLHCRAEALLANVYVVSGYPVFLILAVQLPFLLIKEAMIFPHWHKSGTSEKSAETVLMLNY
jgi:hypothetical protein